MQNKIIILIKALLLSCVFLFSLAFFQGCDDWCVDSNKGRIHGTGHIIRKDLTAQDFSEIIVKTFGNAIITESDEYSVYCEIDDAIENKIHIFQYDHTLVIDIENDYSYNNCAYDVYISMPTISRLISESAGNIVVTNTAHNDEIYLEAGSAGNISAGVNVNELRTDILSAGNISLSGTADIHHSTVASAGNLNAFDLVTNSTYLSVSSAGNASINVNDYLEVDISSVGSVYYKGTPRVSSHTSSLGRLINVN